MQASRRPRRRWTSLLERAEISPAVAMVILGRLWGSLAAPITLTLLATKLDADELGYYYAFIGLGGAGAFMELGITMTCGMQMAAAMGQLQLTPDQAITGDVRQQQRLRWIFRTLLVWSGFTSLVLVTVIAWVGSRVLASTSASVTWQLPWGGYICAVAVSSFNNVFLVLLENLGLVDTIARWRFLGLIAGTVAAWLGFLLGAGLYVLTINLGVTTACLAWLTLGNYRRLIGSVVSGDCGNFSYRQELFPLQHRIACSWVGGYLAFSLFPTVAFPVLGPVTAGRLGYSFTVLNTIVNLSHAWLGTRLPLMIRLVAQNNLKEFRQRFLRAARVSMIVFACGLMGVLTVKNMTSFPYHDRLLPWGSLALLMMGSTITFAIGVPGLYFRAFRLEPFWWASVLFGALYVAAGFAAARSHGLTGMLVVYLAVSVVAGITSWIVFRRAVGGPGMKADMPPAPVEQV